MINLSLGSYIILGFTRKKVGQAITASFHLTIFHKRIFALSLKRFNFNSKIIFIFKYNLH